MNFFFLIKHRVTKKRIDYPFCVVCLTLHLQFSNPNSVCADAYDEAGAGSLLTDMICPFTSGPKVW